MPVGDYELRRVEWSVERLAVVLLTLVSAGINFAFATTTDQLVFAILALGLLVGFIVFFTDLWTTTMYLLGAAYVAIMAAVGIVVGMPNAWLGMLDSGIKALLLSLCCYLFVLDRTAVAGAGEPQGE